MRQITIYSLMMIAGLSSAYGMAKITQSEITTRHQTKVHGDGIVTGCDSVGDACLQGCKSGDHGSYWSIVPSGMLPCTPGWFGNGYDTTPCDTRTYTMPNCPPSDYNGNLNLNENACPQSSGSNPLG